MHHSMLPLIISCSRSWNFAWHHLRRSTTESKNIVKHLAIRQTIHTCASSKIIFQRENLNYSIVCFTQCTLFFQNVCFPLSICLPYVICGSYVTKINAVVTQRAADICVAWLVYVRTYCVPIATLNQTNRTEQAISEFQKISLSKRG